jgi:membrane protein implicated in regulation of membrane protease activity
VSREPEDDQGPRAGIHGEDVLILLSVAALFVLTVFCRHTWWGQGALIGLLVLMAVVFWRRFRRVHRAFTGREDET